jgi:hypothetical protein
VFSVRDLNDWLDSPSVRLHYVREVGKKENV